MNPLPYLKKTHRLVLQDGMEHDILVHVLSREDSRWFYVSVFKEDTPSIFYFSDKSTKKELDDKFEQLTHLIHSLS